ncbi:MAG: hypothetical protein Q9207_002818 [Kuettlingeria erythrocarpa]
MGVITAFYIRIPVVALTLVRNHYVQELLTSPDAGLVSRTIVIWQEAELAYSIAAATLMCLKPLVRDFNTSFGLGGEMVRTHAASGYIASNSNPSGLASKMARLRAYRGGKHTEGSTFEMQTKGSDFPPNDRSHVLVSERRLDDRLNIQPHLDSSTTTTVTHDPQNRPQGSGESPGVDDIVVTHRVEQSARPRNMLKSEMQDPLQVHQRPAPSLHPPKFAELGKVIDNNGKWSFPLFRLFQENNTTRPVASILLDRDH